MYEETQRGIKAIPYREATVLISIGRLFREESSTHVKNPCEQISLYENTEQSDPHVKRIAMFVDLQDGSICTGCILHRS